MLIGTVAARTRPPTTVGWMSTPSTPSTITGVEDALPYAPEPRNGTDHASSSPSTVAVVIVESARARPGMW